MLVDVEILDVSEEEARKLLLSIDPLAALAVAQREIHDRLREITPVEDAELKAFWENEAQKLLAPEPPEKIKEIAEQFLIVVTCRDEKQQVELLGLDKKEAQRGGTEGGADTWGNKKNEKIMIFANLGLAILYH